MSVHEISMHNNQMNLQNVIWNLFRWSTSWHFAKVQCSNG